MFDDLYTQERGASLSQMVQRPDAPPPDVGAFTGFGSALADALPHAALTAGSSWSAVLDAFGKTMAYTNAPTVALMHGEAPPDPEALKRETLGRLGENPVGDKFREEAKAFAPDPAAVGVAGQIAHGLVSMVGKAVGYTAAFGPAAPAVFGGDIGIGRAQELTDQGVDGGTAALAGLSSGAVAALGLRLPPALGATRFQSALIGAGINPALGIADRAAIKVLLEHADYPAIAAQYQPFDPKQLAVEALAGAAFGGLFHSARVREGATLTADEQAALRVMQEVRTREADTLTRPNDMAAANAAHDAQLIARGQMDAGEPVSVARAIDIDPQRFAEAAGRVIEELRAELAADTRPEAKADLAMIEQGKIPPRLLETFNDRTADIVRAADSAPAPRNALETRPDDPAPQLQPGGQKTQPAPAATPSRPSAEGGKAETPKTPEMLAAAERLEASPDMVIRLDDGAEVRAADALREADAAIQQAEREAGGFQAAIACALRFDA